MQNLLFLNDAIPVLIIGTLALFMTLEQWLPNLQMGSNRRRQRWRNVGLLVFAFVVNALIGAMLLSVVVWTEQHQFGLLHLLLPHTWTAIIIGILLVDFVDYTFHLLQHKIPFLFRIHAVHHAETELDSTSGLRLHPFELILQMFYQSIFFALLGIPVAGYLLYFAFALPWFIVNHSNVRFPDWFERIFGWWLVTPNWHRVHHSSYQPETDSHFGDLFTFWDRMFGTARPQTDVKKIIYGLEYFRQPEDQTVWRLLKMPFRKIEKANDEL